MQPLRTVLSLIAIFTLSACAAQTQATRTWVSGTGSDANTCSRTGPCLTFAGAIAKTAAGGEIDVLDPGDFGPVTITKSITIDGGGGQVASIRVSGTNGVVVAAGPHDIVEMRYIRIQGLAQTETGGLNGIQMNSGYALHIDHCVIANFTQNGINIATNDGGQVFIDDTVSQDNGGNGLNVVATATNVHVNVSNSHFSNNTNGIYSGDFSRTAVRNSDANGNTHAGFIALGNVGSATLSLADSSASNNLGSAVEAGGGGAVSSIRVTNVSLFSNVVGFKVGTNGVISSFGNNSNAGSFTPNAKIAPQ